MSFFAESTLAAQIEKTNSSITNIKNKTVHSNKTRAGMTPHHKYIGAGQKEPLLILSTHVGFVIAIFKIVAHFGREGVNG